MRLISTGEKQSGSIMAAVEIVLQPGFKTYWRSPGDAGVPPGFDFAGSDNLASAEVLYPLPTRFEDGGGRSIGYHDRVIFPVRIVPADPEKPVKLVLRMTYGACEKICIPAEGEAALELGARPDELLINNITAAFLSVPPRAEGLGATDESMSIAAIIPKNAEKGIGAPLSRIEVLVANAEATALLAEGPRNWYLEAGKGEASPDGVRFLIDLYGPKKNPLIRPCPLILTIIGKERSIERHVTLDECGAKP